MRFRQVCLRRKASAGDNQIRNPHLVHEWIAAGPPDDSRNLYLRLVHQIVSAIDYHRVPRHQRYVGVVLENLLEREGKEKGALVVFGRTFDVAKVEEGLGLEFFHG